MIDPIEQIRRICIRCYELAEKENLVASGYIKESPCSSEICFGCPYRVEIIMVAGNHPDRCAIISSRFMLLKESLTTIINKDVCVEKNDETRNCQYCPKRHYLPDTFSNQWWGRTHD